MLYLTNKARESHIEEITRLIDVLGHITSGELTYIDYRRLIGYLADHRNLIIAEVISETQDESDLT